MKTQFGKKHDDFKPHHCSKHFLVQRERRKNGEASSQEIGALKEHLDQKTCKLQLKPNKSTDNHTRPSGV